MAGSESPDIRVESKGRSDLADRDTPLIRNEWYVAALAEEVTRTPLRRTILEQDIVFYRKEDGTPVALQNRCAHRSYPLSCGPLKGDRIMCNYHGFEYGPDGRCTHVPSMASPPAAVRVRSYDVIECGPFIWIWTGDPEFPDRRSRFIDQPWYDPKKWRWVAEYIPMNANYLGLHENLFDLSHFPFLHTFAKGKLELASYRPKVQMHADRLHACGEMHNFSVPPLARDALGLEGPVTEISNNTIYGPAMHIGDVEWVDSASPPTRFKRMIIHCATPASQLFTHYFWAISRNGGLDIEALDEADRGLGNLAFNEDRVALEAIEEIYRNDKRPDFREKIVPQDNGAIQALRFLAKRAREEAAE